MLHQQLSCLDMVHPSPTLSLSSLVILKFPMNLLAVRKFNVTSLLILQDLVSKKLFGGGIRRGN